MATDQVSVDIPVPGSFDILASGPLKINQKNLLEYSKDNELPREEHSSYKAIKFLPGWTFQDTLKEISKLNPKLYKNLFVFIINIKEVSENKAKAQLSPTPSWSSNSKGLKNELERAFFIFCKSRQIIIQLTSENDKKTKIFYNEEKSMKILREIEPDSDYVEAFPYFLRSYLKLEATKSDEEKIFNMLENPDKLTLRFLTIFHQTPEFSYQIISHCAAKFSKAHFFAAFGIPFEDEEGSFNKAQSKMIYAVFKDQKYRSVLEAALENENSEVFKYLNRDCWYLIQQLPKDYQIEIANKLVQENKIDKLCDLLDVSDFLFPTETDLDTIDNERFKKIVTQRKDFHAAILNENYDEINKFLRLNSENEQLKIVYSIDNKSAMFTALNNNKFDVFLHLKKKGFEGRDNKGLKSQLMTKNILQSEIDSKNAVHFLAARSRIHRNEGDQPKLVEQRRKIMSWFEAIKETQLGSSLVDAAAQCDDLKIIFDFGRNDVAKVDLDSIDADGITYMERKVIIIGAKYSSKENEQKIKGTLAHELAHYVIGMVFGNEEQPYYNKSDPRYQKYKNIVNKYKYLKYKRFDDECGEIISSVYRFYKEDEIDAELIVRIFEIQARFDDNQVKVEQLVKKYSDLFEFGLADVISEMKKFNLNQFEFARIFNDFTQLLPNICDKNLKLPVSESVKGLLVNNLTVVVSNVPKLFLIEVYNHLFELFGDLAKAKNIFVTQECLARKEIRKYFWSIVEKHKELNIFVDFSRGNFEVLRYFEIPSDRCFIIVVSNEAQSKEVIEITEHEKLKIEQLEISYEWKNLDIDVQSKMLQYEVSFQNNSKKSLNKLFETEQDLSKVFDSEMLNMILNEQEIQINRSIGLVKNKKFELLHLERGLVKYEKCEITKTFSTIIEDKPFKMLFSDKIVLISDVAGSGKSWMMRNLAIKLVRFRPTRWVTFVDLKQFIPYFKKCIDENKVPSFHSFMVEEVLHKNTNFEVEIFKLKYKEGEASIFLDGFDEIAPNYAEYVRKIIKSFNFCNQLFISTRDYFEIDLQNDLEANFIFKLDQFSQTDGEELITRIWRLNDFKSLENVALETDIIDSEKYINYIAPARKVIEKINKINCAGIGLSQIYSMIATITKDKKTLDGHFSAYQLYLKMYEMTYEEWLTRTELRMEVNTKSQKWKINFSKLHELKAMQRFAPEKFKYCDINRRYEWVDVLVDGCGILAKREKDFVFIHETFYEFFVAAFILRNLRDLETAAEAFKYMQDVMLGVYKNGNIRKFLNEGLMNEKNEIQTSYDENIFDERKKERIELLVENINKSLINDENICDIFTKKLRVFDCIGNFLMEILMKSDIKLEELLTKEMKKFISSENDDLKKELEQLQKRLVELVISSFDLDTLINAANELDEKSLLFFNDSLEYRYECGKNIFWRLAHDVEVLNDKRFEKFLAFLRAFLTPHEIAAEMKVVDKDGSNIFHHLRLCKDILKFEIFWRGFQRFFEAEFSLVEFKTVFVQQDGNGRNILIEILLDKELISVDEHERIWNLVLKTLANDANDFVEIILQQDILDKNYVLKLIDLNNRNKLNFALNKLKNVLKKSDWDTILNLKSNDLEKNVLLYTIYKSKNVEIHEVIFEFCEALKESKEEFSKVFTEQDFYGHNFFHHMIKHSSEDVLNIYMKKLSETEILSRKNLKNLLSTLNKFDQNILQYAGLFNIGFKMINFLNEYFKPEEIVKLVKHRDCFGKNYLHICLMHTHETLVEEKVNEIVEEITKSGLANEKQVVRLKVAVKNKIFGHLNEEDLEILSLDWIQDGNLTESFQPIKYHELKELLLYENGRGENFIHENLSYRYYEVNYIQSILEKVETELDAETLKQLFISTRNEYGMMNLMQILVKRKVSISFYEYLWKLMREKFDNETILAILKYKDKWERNLLLTVAIYGSKQVAAITWKNIEEISEYSSEKFKNQITEMVKERSTWKNANILQLAAYFENCSLFLHLSEIGKNLMDIKSFAIEVNNDKKYPTILFYHTKCEDKKCHEALWTILLNSFEDRDELLTFVLQTGDLKINFVYDLIKRNKSVEIIGFILETLKYNLSQDLFMMSKDSRGRNLLQSVLYESKNVQTVEMIWKHCENLKNFSNFILDVDRCGRSIIHLAARFSTADVFDFLCERLRNLNEKDKVRKAILRKPNVLIDAAWWNKSERSHDSLWKLLYIFLDKDDILRMVLHINHGNNILQIAVERNTLEVIRHMWGQIKNIIADEKERNDYLGRKDRNGRSLRELAIKKCQMVELIKDHQSI